MSCYVVGKKQQNRRKCYLLIGRHDGIVGTVWLNDGNMYLLIILGVKIVGTIFVIVRMIWKTGDQVLKKIKNELNYLRKVKATIARKVENAPEGKLRCAISKGYFQYYIGDRYLKSKDKKIAIKLAEKEYSLKIEKLIKRYEHALEEILDFVENERLQNVYRELHPARKVLIEPLYRPVEEMMEEFEQLTYVGKEFGEENKTAYYTIKGERVRSKSEKIIADELYRHGIPYKYELPIELEVWNKKITIYPDFTVLNKRTGKKWIIEHLGMMDKSSYSESAMQKLDTYEKNDILLGRDLLLLHETSISQLDTKVLEKYINEYLC